MLFLMDHAAEQRSSPQLRPFVAQVTRVARGTPMCSRVLKTALRLGLLCFIGVVRKMLVGAPGGLVRNKWRCL